MRLVTSNTVKETFESMSIDINQKHKDYVVVLNKDIYDAFKKNNLINNDTIANRRIVIEEPSECPFWWYTEVKNLRRPKNRQKSYPDVNDYL